MCSTATWLPFRSVWWESSTSAGSASDAAIATIPSAPPCPSSPTPSARSREPVSTRRAIWPAAGRTALIDFLGRVDHMIKLQRPAHRAGRDRGRRSRAIRRSRKPASRPASIRRGTAAGGLSGAFRTGADRGTDEELRRFLAGSLPQSMVPAHFHVLDEMPLTANGKLDSDTAAAAGLAGRGGQRFVAPSTPVEEAMARIWAEVLERERDRGERGLLRHRRRLHPQHSGRGPLPARRHAGQAVRDLPAPDHRRPGRRTAVHATALGAQDESGNAGEPAAPLASAPSICNSPSDLCDSTRSERPHDIRPILHRENTEKMSDPRAPTPIPSRPCSRECSSTASRPRIGRLCAAIVEPAAGELRVAAFQSAWEELLARHGVLRTAFAWKGLPEPLQVLGPRVKLPLEVLDWRDVPAEDRAAALADLERAERKRGFDLSSAPLMRLKLIRLADDAHRLIWTWHHAILDAWSAPIVLEELFILYAALCEGRASGLEPSRPFKDFIAWRRPAQGGGRRRGASGGPGSTASRSRRRSTSGRRRRQAPAPMPAIRSNSSTCRRRKSQPCGMPRGRWG